MTDRWMQWRRQWREGVLEDRAQGGLGHPHSWPDATAGVWRLLLHERYDTFSINTLTGYTCVHVNMPLHASRSHPPLSEYGVRSTFITLCSSVFCASSQMTHNSRIHFTLTFLHCPHRLILSAGEMELRCMCVCMCEREKRDVSWPEHKSFKVPWNCVH